MSGIPGQDDDTATGQSDNSADKQAANQDENVDYKALYEIEQKRRKDTQAAFTKSQQALKQREAENRLLQEKAKQALMTVDPETAKRLDELKYADPEAWRAEMNNIEAKKTAEFNDQLTAEGRKAAWENELDRRAQVLKDFNASHPGFSLNDEIIANDVPKRIFARLEKGEVDFETFLVESHEFLTGKKVVHAGDSVLNQPNLNSVGGGGKPSDSSTEKDIMKSYKDEVY